MFSPAAGQYHDAWAFPYQKPTPKAELRMPKLPRTKADISRTFNALDNTQDMRIES